MRSTLPALRLTLGLALLVSGGCTAARASYLVLDAEQKYKTAVSEGADEKAVYEITMAKEFLWKAKEEVNSSDFGAAEALCKKSKAYSQEAYDKSVDRGVDVGNADEFVPETKPEVPVEDKPKTEEPVIDLDDL